MASARVHTVSVEEAGPQLDALIDEVLAGEAVVIARRSGPGVRLVREEAVEPSHAANGRIGSMAGRIAIDDDEAVRSLPDEWLGLDLWTDTPL